MLFNSPEFLFLFLPVTLVVFSLLRLAMRWAALCFLIIASLVFYAWSEPRWVFVLMALMVLNYGAGMILRRRVASRILLAAIIALNLVVLAVPKYGAFAIANLNALGIRLDLVTFALPIGISFFVFQQIAYIIDCYRREIMEHGFAEYAAFITFFPHFISGPILFSKNMLPQLADRKLLGPSREDILVGGALLVIGLAKKLVVADHVEIFASPVFDAALNGKPITFLEAWGGALAYTFQIYFDFSGYSDMAIGIARLFGLRIPINFDSPYKANNIIDFWRRWHMSLSTFLRIYLYIPLGGNRFGPIRRYGNLMTVMLLGGLWHGAGWGFVVWGGLHGVYLVINHWFRHWLGESSGGLWERWCGRILTFMAVVVAWVFFRSESFGAAGNILSGMAGLNGFFLDMETHRELGVLGRALVKAGWQLETSRNLIFTGVFECLWLAILLSIVWFLPSSTEQVASLERQFDEPRRAARANLLLAWRPSMEWFVVAVLMLMLSLPHIFEKRPFLYFQF